MIISVIAFKEKLERKKLIAIILSFIGTFISAYSGNQSFSFVGIVLALSAGIFYASYVALIGHGQFKNIHPLVMTGYLIIGASLSFTIYGLLMGDFVLNIEYYAWINIFLLGLFSTTIAIMIFCAGAKIIGTSKAAIISTVEPMITYFFGFVFLGEKIKINMVIGGLIVISAIIILNLNNFLVENKWE
ncbi:hypothetical protein Q428_12185 [Fervidicella metallireducens AeB]|uniref:EamA domain-containing protein n=1 Tax=Fervidicella metallireducens AeB TaxID=1403537 RepID=A0A017RUR7_9CLOT|nr:DMT family transporter [Fervidicella metallireducens]EYE87625.1 hypothetical protein Q428_12185 [Fervidicella metallireducens AeB]